MDARAQWVNTADQQRLYVKSWGDGRNPALILVHGYPDHQEVWERVIPHLVQDFFVVTYDVRGAGQSSAPRRVKDYRLEQLSADLASVAQALLGSRSFHLAAHDWGSIQSWESVTDARFRGRILSYTTISGPCLDHAAFWMRRQFRHEKAEFFRQLGKSWYIAAFQLPFLAPAAWRFFFKRQYCQRRQIRRQAEPRQFYPAPAEAARALCSVPGAGGSAEARSVCQPGID